MKNIGLSVALFTLSLTACGSSSSKSPNDSGAVDSASETTSSTDSKVDATTTVGESGSEVSADAGEISDGVIADGDAMDGETDVAVDGDADVSADAVEVTDTSVGPATYGGLYIDAADLTTCAGGGVSTWPNRVTDGSPVTQATAANQPVCNKNWNAGTTVNAVNFTAASSQYLNAASTDVATALSLGHASTVWGVVYIPTTAATGNLFGGDGSQRLQILVPFQSASALLGWWSEGSSIVSQLAFTAPTTAKAMFVAYVRSGATPNAVTFYSGATPQAGSSACDPPGTQTLSTFSVGTLLTGGTTPTNSFQGQIRALGVHPVALTAAQLAAIQASYGL